ncbi:MAG: MFS transporter [Proteobacteria bacterium]|nr:MFS transporter [Pseudomonadota bacterium]
MNSGPRGVALVAVGTMLVSFGAEAYTNLVTLGVGRYFPSSDPSSELLLTISFYSSGLTPVIGAAALGTVSDWRSRKLAIVFSFLLFGLSTLALALVPPYDTLHTTASILVVLFHLLQGFSFGGCIVSVTVLLLEAAPPDRRGLYVSVQAFSAGLGSVLAGLVAVARWSNPNDPRESILRISFLFSALLVPWALITWKHLEDVRERESASDPPIRPDRLRWGAVVASFLAVMSLTVLSSAQLIAQTNVKPEFRTANTFVQIALASSTVAALFAPVGGWLSDIFGRRPLVLVPGILLLVLFIPIFLFVVTTKFVQLYLIAMLVLVILRTLYGMATLVALTEVFPTPWRARGMGIVQTVAILTGMLLIGRGGHSMTNGDVVDLGFFCVVGIVAMFWFPETAPGKLKGSQQ